MPRKRTTANNNDTEPPRVDGFPGASPGLPDGKPRKRIVSRVDVARLAGVSRTTVSNVFNGTGYASEEVKERVRRAAEALGYAPSPVARSLATRSSRQVAVVVAGLTHPFFAAMVTEITKRLHDAGFRSLVVEGSWVDVEYVKELYQGLVDGVIVADANAQLSAAAIQSLLSRGVPLIGHCLGPGVVPSVEPDFEHGMRAIFDHLQKLGHRRIAFVGPALEGKTDQRLYWYRCLVKERELADDPLLEACVRSEPTGEPTPSAFSMKSGYDAAKALAERGVHFTGAIAASDSMAVGALKAFTDLGIRVPQDVSLVGWDDIPMAEFIGPGLTTLRVSPDDLARHMVDGLCAALAGDSPTGAKVRGRLVVRGSTGPPRTV